ncbi:ribosome-associated translation inhibitor RaiA [Nakamurella silvestris]|nr:ribosome-associated translation inhibitor RaiA [Nakamurella silvestris]
MDIVVTGRNVEVPEHYRNKVEEKLGRLEKFDNKIIRAEVELSHESNRRQAKVCQTVQITLLGRGPAVRAEAHAENYYAALESAVDKLESRARRASERRHDRRTSRTPISAVAAPADVLLDGPDIFEITEPRPDDVDAVTDTDGDDARGSDGGPGRIVRIKDHPAEPINTDQALFQMELVGHDFYLFNDSETGLASVVYRRKGFDYGLLRLG